MEVQDPGLSEAEIAFIQSHLHENVSQLVLKAGQFKGLDVKKLAGQILSRQKAAKKLPDWYQNKNLIFPPALSVEQCSSEATARYKARLISGKKLTDITGGMGVDSFYLSKNFEKVAYYEQQEAVAATARYNFEQLGASHISVHNEDSLEALASQDSTSDWIYADPARRNENREKVVRLADCTPDILSNLAILFKNAAHILLKTSPLLDIALACDELGCVKEVYTIGYEQECKELLFVLDRNFKGTYSIKARVLDHDGNARYALDFDPESERNAEISYAAPLDYLYEPHPAVLKAGAFKTICERYQVHKLAANSQLYSSKDLATNFPGRTMEIRAVCKPDMREIAKHIGGDKANLTVRNFPAKTEDLRKKWKLKEGGDFYLFATTLTDQSKVVIVTVKAAI
jgi:hypothetical protein